MNIAAGSKIVHKECEPLRMCKGPEGSVFVIDEQGELLQLKWKEEKEELKLVHRIQTGVSHAWGMWEDSNILVITSDNNIKAINPVTGSVVWKFTEGMKSKELEPWGVCCDLDGRIYVADGSNERLLILDMATGKLIQTLSDAGSGGMWRVYWMNNPPQLIVCHGYIDDNATLLISTYDIQFD